MNSSAENNKFNIYPKVCLNTDEFFAVENKRSSNANTKFFDLIEAEFGQLSLDQQKAFKKAILEVLYGIWFEFFNLLSH